MMISAIIAGVSAAAAMAMAWLNYKSLNEIRIERMERNRPIVECYLAISRNAAVFRIQNVGNRLAKDVTIHLQDKSILKNLEIARFDDLSKSTFDVAAGEHWDLVLGNPCNVVKIKGEHHYSVEYKCDDITYHEDCKIKFDEYGWARLDPDEIKLLEDIRDVLKTMGS